MFCLPKTAWPPTSDKTDRASREVLIDDLLQLLGKAP